MELKRIVLLALLLGGFSIAMLGVGLRSFSLMGIGVIIFTLFISLIIMGTPVSPYKNVRHGKILSVAGMALALVGMSFPLVLVLASPMTGLSQDFLVGWYAIMIGILQFNAVDLMKLIRITKEVP